MLIGLCGGICAGKHSIAEYLVREHGFQRLLVDKTSQEVPDHRRQWTRSPAPDTAVQIFPSVDNLLDFVTTNWTGRWVIADIWDDESLDKLLVRPFFLLVSVDAPITLRWRRFLDRCRRDAVDPPDLETFLLWDDQHLYEPKFGLAFTADRAHVRLFNSSSSLDELCAALDALNLTNEERLRPNWDQYFMQLASLAAQRSNCMKRRVGCVLVKNKRVMSTGYNGTPRNTKNCNQGGCPRCNLGQAGGAALSTCLCIHAEENALLEAGRERIGEGSILYCNTCPCLTCSVKIAQMGISEVVYSHGYNMDTETAGMLKQAGVKLRQFFPPRNRPIDLQSSGKPPEVNFASIPDGSVLTMPSWK